MDTKAYTAALALLARRDHSKKELAQKLSKKFTLDFRELEILLEALVSSGYQDDLRFAENYTRSRLRKGFGPERIRLELKQKGVSNEVIDEILRSSDWQWLEAAESVLKKKYAKIPSDLKEKAQQSHFLRYRGFNSDQVRAVFDGIQEMC